MDQEHHALFTQALGIRKSALGAKISTVKSLLEVDLRARTRETRNAQLDDRLYDTFPRPAFWQHIISDKNIELVPGMLNMLRDLRNP